MQVLPAHPEIGLEAAIQWGAGLPTGNMANFNLIPQSQYNIGDAIRRLPLQADSILAGLLYTTVVVPRMGIKQALIGQ